MAILFLILASEIIMTDDRSDDTEKTTLSR